MAENSKIEWCDHTDNLWWGCKEVHEGCDNCYARVLAHRYKQEVWGNDAPRLLISSVWNDMAKQQKKAAEAGEMRIVFINSMSDIFEKPMPICNRNGDLLEGISLPGIGYIGDSTGKANGTMTTGHLRDKLFEQISVGKYPNLIFLLLTKRPGNINKYIPEAWKTNPPANVMFGTSPVNQKTAGKLINQLLEVNGKRFLSIEPQLEEIDLTKLMEYAGGGFSFRENCLTGRTYEWDANGTDGVYDHGFTEGPAIHWVINGGESGTKKRPFNCDWARTLRDQCTGAGVPFFFKQVDKVQPIPDDLKIRQFPEWTN